MKTIVQNSHNPSSIKSTRESSTSHTFYTQVMPELLGVRRAWNNLTTEPDSDFNFPASYMCFFGCVCRVMFGTSHLYVFHHPAEAQSSSLKQADITYEMAQEEIAKNAGLDVDDQESKGEEDVELSSC